MSQEYSEKNIKILSDLDHIRLRLGMYIGENTDPRHLFSEAFDNAVDELQTGSGNEIRVSVDTKKNLYEVVDNGRGIPHGTKKMGEEDVEILKLLCIKSNTGAKFDKESYLMSAGLHGVGLAVINALSSYLCIHSTREGKRVLYNAHKDELIFESVGKKEAGGTYIGFIPDKKYFQQENIPVEFLIERCKTANAFGIKVSLTVDGKDIPLASQLSDLIKKEDGVKEYGEYPVIYTSTDKNSERLIILLQYTSDTKDKYYGYTNLLFNSQGGTHVNFVSSKVISLAWEEYIKKSGIKTQVELKRSDYLTGLRCVVAAFISNPSFAGQTKEKLSVDKAKFDTFLPACQKELVRALKSNESLSNALIKRFEEYRIAQNKLLSRKEISSFIKQNTDSSDNIRRKFICDKLTDCSSKSRDNTELYICLKGNTKIRTANGDCIPIEQLVSHGSLMLSSINNKFELINSFAHNIRETKKVSELMKIILSDGSFVECTPEHRFLTAFSKEWVEAKDINLFTKLMSINTNDSVVIKILKITYEEPIPVYCLTVENDMHAYILENGLITHNCEGASAAGPACRMRNSEKQAVLQLRGKILNVTGMDVQKAIKSEEVCNITNSIGCGIGSQCDSDKSRYERVMINTDGDEDGLHIICLVLSVFINLLPDIVKDGRLFVVVPPLYGWQDKNGNHFTNERSDIPNNCKLKRYKGLGSMSDKDFFTACMNDKERKLIQVDYPTDIDEFNKILGTSSGKAEILKDLGLIRYE